ncbi:MAG: carboxylating nicotinate-nucleotide diphosphorylase, partial [Spirochaetales bacterium]|nr:carboxylating nicotinate-nucleotide diphosphorylase [Spirochaetales bacterium]
SRFAAQSNGKLKILDTRKTIPGLRYLQKYAVACGGGQNHRIGLFDMVLIKDNHIDAAGSIRAAVENVRKMWGDKFKIEVETRNLDEVRQALEMHADRIMLDNMPDDVMAEAVKIIDGKAEIEASGNMTIDRIAPLSKIGIDFISFGELTHTVKVFDFSLKK